MQQKADRDDQGRRFGPRPSIEYGERCLGWRNRYIIALLRALAARDEDENGKSGSPPAFRSGLAHVHRQRQKGRAARL